MDPRQGNSRQSPERTCVSCRRTHPKQDLTRFVKTPTQTIQVDQSGHTPGRGAYLCHVPACWTDAAASKHLASALRTSLSKIDWRDLRVLAGNLPTNQKFRCHDD